MNKSKLRRVFFVMVCALLCVLPAACTKNEDDDMKKPTEKPTVYEWEKYLDHFRYTETDEAGNTLSIYAYYTAGRCVINITHPDGTKQKFYAETAQVLYDLKDYNDIHKLTEWDTIGPDTPELDKAQQIRVSCRYANRDYDFGTNHMPDPDGIEKLHTIRDMLLSATSEDAEIKSFTVTIYGKQYQTIAGTGNVVGTGALIDFGDDLWWEVEKFTGHFELSEQSLNMTEEVSSSHPVNVQNAYADILADGSIHVVVDDLEFTGKLDSDRGWMVWATALDHEMYLCFEDKNQANAEGNDAVPKFLHIRMQPEPVPGTFPGVEIILERQ